MNSFNVYGYRLKSTDNVAMKDKTDIRHLTGLSNPDDLRHVHHPDYTLQS
jgi:hypothetical protein